VLVLRDGEIAAWGPPAAVLAGAARPAPPRAEPGTPQRA
jgi:hypothetical protein